MCELCQTQTTHREFRNLALSRIAKIRGKPALLDTGNIAAPAKAQELGFSYMGVGRQASAWVQAGNYIRESKMK